MYEKYFILVLCLFLLGGSLEAKTDQDPNDWTISNTMSREDHEHHVAVRPSETIDIDERPPQGGFYSGDGSELSDDDMSSGMGWDDEDDSEEEGSAGMSERSDCIKIRDEMKNQGIKGYYIPKCTSEGEFETKQCDSSTNQCWCVDSNGDRIGETRDIGERLDCSHVKPVIVLTKCQREYELGLRNQMPGAWSGPRCTPDGAYEKKQCHGSTGHCWCVEEDGLEIGGTRRGPGLKLDCENVVPLFPESVSTPKPRDGAGKGMDEDDDISLGTGNSEEEMKNSIDNMGPVDATVEIKEADPETNNLPQEQPPQNDHGDPMRPHALLQPGLLAGIIGGAVVGLLCAVLLVMFIVYRMRKKDEGSYALDEPKRSPSLHTYARATNREFYA